MTILYFYDKQGLKNQIFCTAVDFKKLLKIIF